MSLTSICCYFTAKTVTRNNIPKTPINWEILDNTLPLDFRLQAKTLSLVNNSLTILPNNLTVSISCKVFLFHKLNIKPSVDCTHIGAAWIYNITKFHYIISIELHLKLYLQHSEMFLRRENIK